jgi:thiamine-monophosphate kinase
MHSVGGAEAGPERLFTEDDLIAEIGAITAVAAPHKLLVGIGDDAAVWQPSRSHRSVITTDALVEGVHFTLAAMPARDVGYRALASNLSDIAAMGATPVLATIALSLGPATDAAWVLECYRGMTALAARSGCAIAGGDIVRAPATALAITVIGEVRPSNCKTRSGMLPGDTIAVTGPLGASRAGLAVAVEHPELAALPDAAEALRAFRTPTPRLAEGRWFGASRNVRAMMDCSDGPSTDLARLAAASGVGVVIDAIPVAPAAHAIAAACGADAARWALDGGEDFELIVAVATRAFTHLAGRFRSRFGRELMRIGYATEEGGVRFADGKAVERAGWDHIRA